MIEIILSLIPAGLLIWVPVLIVIGYLLKHGTRFPNGFITVALFGVSAVVSAIYGYGATEGMEMPLRATEVLLAYALGYGFLLAITAVFLYDAVHGAMKHIREKGKKATSGEEEEIMAKTETTERGRGRRGFRMTSFLTYLLVVIGSVVLGTLMALPWGIGSAVDFVSKAVFLGVIMVMAADIAFKVRFEKWKLIWQYWIGIAFIVGADWCFFWASMTTTWGQMGLALGCVALFGVCAGAWFWLVYHKRISEKEEAYLAEYEKALVDKGVDADTAAAVAASAKEV